MQENLPKVEPFVLTRSHIENVFIPPIQQKFSRDLLSLPYKFNNDDDDIRKILSYVKAKLFRKLDKCLSKKKECERLYNEILNGLDAIKKKKEDPETTIKNETERLFYYFKCARGSDTEILRRLVHTARRFSTK